MGLELGIVSQEKITAVRVLSDSEYEEYRKAANCLLRFSSDQQTFLIVRLNYDAYVNLLKRYFEEYTKNPSMSWPRMDRMVLDVNRHILNFLSSVRTFLDHSETNLKRRYGRDSERVRRFKDACSNAYNNNFSYRFLYALRNYAQHCGMPVAKLSLHSKAVDPSFKIIHHYLTVEFNRDQLIKEYDLWGSQLKTEIQKLPPTFDVNQHVTEMMKCLERINLILIEDELPELSKSARYINELIAFTKDTPGTPCVLRPKILARSPEGKAERLDLNIEWMPLHLVEMVMHLEALTSNKAR